VHDGDDLIAVIYPDDGRAVRIVSKYRAAVTDHPGLPTLTRVEFSAEPEV
jgi:hypothetical protein